MVLSRYGLREWVTISLIAAAVACLFAWLGWWWAIIPVAIIWLALVAFFRDPLRRVPENLPPGVMLSPADGTISAILTVDHHEAIGASAVVIRIFLSVLDVHVNRSPCAGRVAALAHMPGKHLDARTEESAQVNESNLITIAGAPGAGDLPIGVRQVSGAIARRIVCRLRVGDRLERGQRFGMIKFGSTTELILPRSRDVRVFVRLGDKVKGGLTQLAALGAAGER
jgi:phosphatidylserine decarboxylase